MTRSTLLAAAALAVVAVQAGAQPSPLLERNPELACDADSLARVPPVDALVDSAWAADAVRDGFPYQTGHATGEVRWDSLGRPLPVAWVESTVGPDAAALDRLGAVITARLRPRRDRAAYLVRVDVGREPVLRAGPSEACAPRLRGRLSRAALERASRRLRPHLPNGGATLVLHVLVDTEGRPARVEARGEEHPLPVREAAVAIVREARWRPGRVNRVVTPQWVTLPVSFFDDGR